MNRFCLLIFLLLILYTTLAKHRALHRSRQTSALKNVFGSHQRIIQNGQSLPPHLQRVVRSDVILVYFDRIQHINHAGRDGYRINVNFPVSEPVCPGTSTDSDEETRCFPLCDRQKDGHPQYDASILMANGAFGSGFLVSPNLVVTAGHIFLNRDSDTNTNTPKRDCSNIAVITSFTTYSDNVGNPIDIGLLKENGDQYLISRPHNVYKCKRIISANLARDPDIDYAVFELDRDAVIDSFIQFVPVQHPMNDDGSNFFTASVAGKHLVNVGHPWGFVRLYDEDAVVSDFIDENNFRATLDGEGGASGSVVADKDTGKAVGMVVRGFSDADLYHMSNDETQQCWLRGKVPNCYNITSHEHDLDKDGISNGCEEVAREVCTSALFYNFIDHNPVSLPSLHMPDVGTEEGGSRKKALQKLLEYKTTNYNGIWDEAFNNFVKDKMRNTKIFGTNPIYCPGCLIHDGETNRVTSVPETVLSLWLPSPCGPNFDCPQSAILAIRELIRNGFNGYDSVDLDIEENKGWTEDLSNAIERFSVAKGYEQSPNVTIPIWRHLWRTENGGGIIENLPP